MNQDKRTSLQPDTQNNVEKCLVMQAGELAKKHGGGGVGRILQGWA